MKKRILLLITLTAVVLVPALSGAASVSVITKETLKEWMNSGSVAVLDARQGRDWKSSEFKIKGAFRTDPGDISAWKGQFAKDKKLVIYCA